MAHSVQFG